MNQIEASRSDASVLDVHDEDRELIEKLAKLQNMYNQLLQLRTLLPERLIGPIKQAIGPPVTSRQDLPPAALAGQLRKVSVEGNREVQNFQKDWYSEEMRTLREKTNEAQFPPGDDCWRANYELMAKSIKLKEEPQNSAVHEIEIPSSVDEEDVKDIVNKANDKYKGIRIKAANETTWFPLSVKVGGMSLFVQQEPPSPPIRYLVTLQPASSDRELGEQVLRCVMGRGSQNSLSYLMSMLASYGDVKTHACDKCMNVFDKDLQFATVKVPKSDLVENATTDLEWLAYHPNCASTSTPTSSVQSTNS